MLAQLSRHRTTAKSFVRRPGVANEDTSIEVSGDEPPPPLHSPHGVHRSHTLSRPERGHPLPPLLNVQGDPDDPFADVTHKGFMRNAWRYISMAATFWAPPPLLAACGFKTTVVRQAWREKVTLVLIAALLSGIVAFITVGLQRSLCPSRQDDIFVRAKEAYGVMGIQGWAYNGTSPALPPDLYPLDQHAGVDLTPYLSRPVPPSCRDQDGAYAKALPCFNVNGATIPCFHQLNERTPSLINIDPMHKMMGYDWQDLEESTTLMAMDGVVLNFQPYLMRYPDPIPGDNVDMAIRLHFDRAYGQGPDSTRLFATDSATRHAMTCVKDKYVAGRINYVSTGCFVAELILYMSLVVILGIVLVRTIMAIWFHYVGSRRLMKPPPPVPNARRARPVSHLMMPTAAGTNDMGGMAPWAGKVMAPPQPVAQRNASQMSTASSHIGLPTSMTQRDIGNDPYVICLVTCYSEGLDGISATLASINETEYPSNRQLLFVVADGMVTGFGETISTPDICVSLMTPDARFGTPMPMSYSSVATGKLAHNMALVYAGTYTSPRGGDPVPIVVVAKCGTPDEARSKKPGNRGKRDSQMILLNFLQRVTYDDPMTPLEYDLFRKVHALMGVTPDFFELILMVDADTKVYKQSLRSLCNAMMTDSRIMGACGETRIQNKSQSWVTMIQVFEYFISHHQIKAFESVFGGVTCLPGCFSIYRIKARKSSDDDWIPVVIKPEVIREYSQSTVASLHQKNLLLLGEDRFLSTMMLRTFPHRKMVFIPQAVCVTEVPHTFRMLLSQRRRWINSTVHNLMELVLVRDLCGTFCFSMQFVVLMDLLGTLVLPVAIALTYTLIGLSIARPPHKFSEAIPLMMLVAVLVLPGAVVALTHKKGTYLGWLLIYLLFLPVWNFVLPIYSFWHFDDFSWGATRKVAGELKDQGHVEELEELEAMKNVPMRKWEDWERSRVRKIKRDERRREEMQSQFGGGFHNDTKAIGPSPATQKPPNMDDAVSIASDWSEDRWGEQVGAYNENGPPGLVGSQRPLSTVVNQRMSSVLPEAELEDMLQRGWEEHQATRPKTKGPFQSIPNHSIVSLQEPTGSAHAGLDRPPPFLTPSAASNTAPGAHSSAVGTGHSTHARNRSFGGSLRFDTPYEPRQSS